MSMSLTRKTTSVLSEKYFSTTIILVELFKAFVVHQQTKKVMIG